MTDDLLMYHKGRITTTQEILQKKLGRKVEWEEVIELVRKQRFTQFINHLLELKNKRKC